MTVGLDGVRQEVRGLLEDMALLKGFADPSNPEAAPFNQMYAHLLRRALEAARHYVELEESP